MNTLLEQLRTWWDAASVSSRIIGVGIIVVIFASLAVAGMLATAPSYEDLFTDLSPDDAAAITQKLDEEHVKYQLADGERTIRVPSKDKDHLRMDMIRQGLPAKASSLMGSEWLKQISMGTTSDVQKQYIRMALEGELSKTIGSLAEVASASVHVSDGNDSPFVSDNVPASASVVVNLKPMMSLSNDQIMGIANLVAKSVKGLDVKNVVVSDGTGAMLWDGGVNPNGPGASGGSAAKIAAEHAYAEQKRKEYQSYLDMVLGPRKSLVTVTAELNYNLVHVTDTRTQKGTLINQSDTSENYTGAGAKGAGGIAGASANTPTGAPPTYPSGSTANGGYVYAKSDATATYSPSQTVTDTSQATGSIQRLAIAVLIDKSIPPATIQSVQTYLSTLAGVTATDPTRAVSVQQVPFSDAMALAEQAQTTAIVSQQRSEMIAKVVAVLLVVGFLFFVFTRAPGTVSRDRVRALETAEARPLLSGGTYGNAEPGMLGEPPLTIEDVLGEMPEVRSRRAIPEIEEQQDEKLEAIREMIRSHSDNVTLLLKGWLADDGGSQ
ncbi:MAG: flagellar basal-body MS-ring/collar protein FliF [Capsulimonadaceae bacterium]|nr:flagellar basal-body MS-ring/collar protein FliF [Capsulimonadaceae bacterium]